MPRSSVLAPVFAIPCAFAIGYFAALLLVVPWQKAALIAVLASIAMFGVFILTGSSRAPARSVRWFLAHPFRGLFVIALAVSIFPVIGVCAETEWHRSLVQVPMAFLWFWMFAAIPTYQRESKA
jgi:hypothetical protein